MEYDNIISYTMLVLFVPGLVNACAHLGQAFSNNTILHHTIYNAVYNTIQDATISHIVQYSTLQHNTIQYILAQYNPIPYNIQHTLQSISQHHKQHSTAQYDTMRHDATAYHTIRNDTMQYNTIQYNVVHSAVNCDNTQYLTISYSALQYKTLYYNTMHRRIHYATI